MSKRPNMWLKASAGNLILACSALVLDLAMGFERGERALQEAELSGAAAAKRAVLGNLGNLCMSAGRFDEARLYFERAISELPSSGENISAALDSLAKIKLLQGDASGCEHLLDRIEASIQIPADRILYAHRFSLLTRVELLALMGNARGALNVVDDVLSLATRAGDYLLTDIALLTRAEFLQQADRFDEAVAAIDEVAPRLIDRPPDLHAHYERAVATLLAGQGHTGTGRSHYDRAHRIYESLHNAPGLLELSRAWDRASAHTGRAGANLSPAAGATPPPPRDPIQETLQTAAGLLLHVGRPELLARELVHLLVATDAVCSATALSRGSAADDVEVLAAADQPAPIDPSAPGVRRLVVGSARERSVEVTLVARPSLEASAAVNAVAQLLSAVHEIERARAEREERLTLWPIDETPTEPGQPVVSGRMRELMTFARRIAGTRVSVLITGESGTGKEILARAIHQHSPRAGKPFLPFNCTAVPREMLESQLFGYRRGAFTGADRDHPGIIRSASDGTLFLDEIGELGLDLQPKLLRFLESGEILPLGESQPMTIDVRIIAATNAGLEQLVRDGRFREDLFYRLNVMPLEVPPLRERRDEIPALVQYFVARAADEFGKGAVRLSEEAMEQLVLYPWPGNIRQLQNELRRVIALADADAVLGTSALLPEIASARPPVRIDTNALEMTVPLTGKLQPTLSQVEHEMIRLALRRHHGRVDAAAAMLGVSRKGLYLKRQRLGL
jgi:DNA-binding NtrC family response regulator/tetratricopeptide (TPR) repeat protein